MHDVKVERMEDFGLWFHTGFTHILDPAGIDHILYIIVLVIPFAWTNWKSLVWLITAFTIGHSLTLALSTLGWINMPSSFVEFAIAATISISCLLNLLSKEQDTIRLTSRYALASIFGCIHGLGFSYLLKSMLGSFDRLLAPLFAFNTGLEAGQLIILIMILIIKGFIQYFTNISNQKITTTTSFVILILSLYYLMERVKSLTAA
ncbi:MAG: HupE/UreJ family protein [Saprospiraceae bacterium]|nr:HupE/UreJ family protein [Saprospiraceae bacterium]